MQKMQSATAGRGHMISDMVDDAIVARPAQSAVGDVRTVQYTDSSSLAHQGNRKSQSRQIHA
jgi:hypothetical protein